MAQIESKGLTWWADPVRSQPGAINHHFGGRGVYFEDPDGHLLELITKPYGSEDDLQTETRELSVTRYIDAPPEKVWDAMVNRQEEWWCPAPWRAEVDEQDRRAGGMCRMTFYGPGRARSCRRTASTSRSTRAGASSPPTRSRATWSPPARS